MELGVYLVHNETDEFFFNADYKYLKKRGPKKDTPTEGVVTKHNENLEDEMRQFLMDMFADEPTCTYFPKQNRPLYQGKAWVYKYLRPMYFKDDCIVDWGLIGFTDAEWTQIKLDINRHRTEELQAQNPTK